MIIQYGIKTWPIVECKPSKFFCHYKEKEVCLVIQGQAIIKTEEDEIFTIKSGDLVELQEGLRCQWHVIKSIKKHFRLGM